MLFVALKQRDQLLSQCVHGNRVFLHDDECVVDGFVLAYCFKLYAKITDFSSQLLRYVEKICTTIFLLSTA